MAKSKRPMDERQADVPELVKHAEFILDALRNAESCETESDFNTNIADAREAVRTLAGELKALETE